MYTYKYVNHSTVSSCSAVSTYIRTTSSCIDLDLLLVVAMAAGLGSSQPPEEEDGKKHGEGLEHSSAHLSRIYVSFS
jgi:hypothetical protein